MVFQNISIDQADERQAEALHHLHNHAFWQGWDEDSLSNFLRDKTIFCLVARLIGVPDEIIGFVLVRHICDEAEILTLAVAPNHRRKGAGYALVDGTLRYLYRQRTQKLFLEVEEQNQAAFALYRRFGFEEIGRRPGYYQTQNGRSDALMMQRIFRQFHE